MRYYAGYAESFYFAYARGHLPFDGAHTLETASLTDCASRSRDIRRIGLESHGVMPAPAAGPGSLPSLSDGQPTRHVLVDHNENRHRSPGIVRHGWSWPLPPRSLALVGTGIYMSTPEFTYLQLAQKLSDLHLALAGCALCAAYFLDPATSKLTSREPITSVERIARYLGGCRGVRGLRRAKESLRYVADGAESPQEVNLFLLMSLPAALGGRGIEGLAFNYLVKPKAGDTAVLDRPDRKSFRIDLGRPQEHKGAEYLGKHHDEQVDEDRERLNALTALGERALQVKYRDLADPVRCERFASQFVRMLGEQTGTPTPSELIARAHLADELFGAGRLEL